MDAHHGGGPLFWMTVTVMVMEHVWRTVNGRRWVTVAVTRDDRYLVGHRGR